MQASRVSLQPGYVLHGKPYRDTSLLIEALTRDHGRVGLIARGVRRSRRSPLAAVLQPFQRLWLSWSGKGELVSLTAAEANGAAQMLRGESLISGFYLNELLLRLLQRHDPHPAIYEAYSAAMQGLVAGSHVEWDLRLFEKRLLQSLGYGLSLAMESTGAAIHPEERYCYHLELGAVPVAPGETCGLMLYGKALLALESEIEPDEEAKGEAKRLMRAALGLYLGDKPLNSRELFRQTLTRRGI